MQAEVNMIERITQAYVAYRGVRLLCVLLVLVSAPLLFVLAGGFPPYAWQLLAQALPQLPSLLAAHGPGAFLALLGVLLLSVTILIAWCVLFWISWRMFAYWRYEQRELRNFAADLQEAQYQAEEQDQYTAAHYADEEEAEEMQLPPRPSHQATRRRVMYPLAPLMEEDETQAEDDDEPFFLPDEEEESDLRLYRDEDDDESEIAGEDSQETGAASMFTSAFRGDQESGPGYDQPFIEHAAPAPLARRDPDSVKHTSYGQVSPFAAAPSVGSLPHLTTTLYNRVPMPHSVAPRSTDPLRDPAPTSKAVPAASAPAKSAGQPAPVARPPVQSKLPAQPSAAPHPLSNAPNPAKVPARPTKQLPAAPAQRPSLARPTNKLTALPPSAAQPPVQEKVVPGEEQMQQKRSAMQSLVELISTVPMVPPKAPIPLARPAVKTQRAAPASSARKAATQFIVSTGLDVGLKRRGKPNEDSLLALQNTRDLRGSSCPVGLFVIADGMGGHNNGQEASHLVIQSLSRTVVPSIIYGPSDDNYAELLAEGVHHANLEVYQRNRQIKADMGTTIAAALLVNSTAYIANAGDSRVYLYRANRGLIQITRDHSTVARLVESGLIKPEEIYTHPRRNEIYRSLGHHPSEDLDKFLLAIEPEDVLLLCSDGLWEMVRDEHIQEIIAATVDQPAQTSAALVQAALDGGGKDNISVIVVYIKPTVDAQSAWAG